MSNLRAPYWANAQKMRFSSDAGALFTVQTNPSKYTLVPLTQVQSVLPAQLGPAIISGPVEYPPGAMILHWDEMSKIDYEQLATYMHLQMSTMIDMEDRGWYGMLDLGRYDYLAGSAQNVGSVDATFICVKPANGIHSTINALIPPNIPTVVNLAGGSIPAGTTTWYALTLLSTWGETTPCAPFSVTAPGNGSATQIIWTPPLSGQYLKARLYAGAEQGSVTPGATTFLMAEVLAPFSQQWIDTTSLNGLFNTATIPTVNQAYLGKYAGGMWINGS